MNSTDQQIKNVVLVHGAFADGSGWRGVYENLTARGYQGHHRPEPAHLAGRRRRGDARVRPSGTVPLLVGHSWGGTVITDAGQHDKVASLVYVAAFAPDAGKSTAQQYEGFAETPDFVIDVVEDGFGFLNPEKFKAGFAHDASDADAAFLRDAQVPINMSVFATPVKNAAWHDKPTWAVIATEDKWFDQAMLQHMAKRAGAQITNVSASHALYVTRVRRRLRHNRCRRTGCVRRRGLNRRGNGTGRASCLRRASARRRRRRADPARAGNPR